MDLSSSPFCTFTPVSESFKKNDWEVKIPVRATKYSAGYDFYSPRDIIIKPHSRSKFIWTDIKVNLPDGLYLQLYIRSSLASKYGILLCGSGVIDGDYFGNPDNDGNIGAVLYNTSDVEFNLKANERFIQGIILPYYKVSGDSFLAERVGGYGSTGK